VTPREASRCATAARSKARDPHDVLLVGHRGALPDEMGQFDTRER
jgi:hypothetical protein